MPIAPNHGVKRGRPDSKSSSQAAAPARLLLAGTAGGRLSITAGWQTVKLASLKPRVTVKFQVTTAAGVALRRLARLGNNSTELESEGLQVSRNQAKVNR